MTAQETVAFVVLFLAAALVAGAEALVLALRYEPAAPAESPLPWDARLRRLVGDSNPALTGLQVFELLVHFVLSLLVTAALARGHGAVLVAGAVVLTVLASLALSEVVRGSLLRVLARESARVPGPLAVRSGLRPFACVAIGLRPLGRLLDGCVDGLAARLKRRLERLRSTEISTREANLLVEQASRHGALLHGESTVLLNLIAFGTEPVKSFMTPRTEIDKLDVRWPRERILATIYRTRHRRFPVIDGSYDRVLGCIVAKEYCLDLARGLEAHLRPLPFVPESKVAGDVFQEMRAAGNHIALVVDEYGSIEGMVTLNGLVSQLMGEIPDEFTGDPVRLLHLRDRTYVVDGAFPVEQLNAELGLHLPVKPNITVAGLVFSLIGHLPQPGETVAFRGATFRVVSLRRNRVVSVEVEKV
jgi:CBS domain containing-hemolysin-like protein